MREPHKFSKEFDRCIRDFAEHQAELKHALEFDPDNKELRMQAVELANRTKITFWFVRDVLNGYDDWETIVWDVYIPEGIDTLPKEDLDHYWEHSANADIRLFIDGESRGNLRGEWISSYSC